MARLGLDYSWARPGGKNIAAKGYTFVARYLSHDAGKTIDAADRDDLRGAGLDLVFVWESTATRALVGHDAGVQDATDALNEANPLGVPSSVPLYFAVDFDINDAQKPVAGEYLKGAASVIGADRVATYGGYWWIKYCVDNGLAKHFWQTLAWSGGQVHPSANIYQNGQSDFGGGADIDEARTDDIGAWAHSVAPAPAPAPAPTPAPTPVPVPSGQTYVVQPNDNLTSIAARYGTTVAILAQLNGIANVDLIRVGQVLHLPGGSNTPVPQPNGLTYTVQANDTLSGIGAHFGVDWHLIASANGIPAPYTIYPGNVLRIPGGNVPTPAPAQVKYIVQPNDTLGAIAAHYGTTYQHLAQINGIANPDVIYPGEVIIIA